jgi:NTE family protein
MTDDALVLSGGGVAGIAWETGVLLGIRDVSPSAATEILAETTRLIGTSAGSTVAAQVASGTPLDDLFAAQTSDATSELSVEVDLGEFAATMGRLMAGVTTPEEGRRRIGAMALEADTSSSSARRAVIEARLSGGAWPDRPLLITAVDTQTGELRVFDRTSGVALVDAVTASCAVPGIWPPVEIDGRHYMDGGVRSISNADLAAGADRILILTPSSETTALGRAIPQAQLDELAPGRVFPIFADDASISAMGANPLDPRTRRPSAEAGQELGRRVAPAVEAWWRGGD